MLSIKLRRFWRSISGPKQNLLGPNGQEASVRRHRQVVLMTRPFHRVVDLLQEHPNVLHGSRGPELLEHIGCTLCPRPRLLKPVLNASKLGLQQRRTSYNICDLVGSTRVCASFNHSSRVSQTIQMREVTISRATSNWWIAFSIYRQERDCIGTDVVFWERYCKHEV